MDKDYLCTDKQNSPMKTQISNLKEFAKQFDKDKDCRAYLEKERWDGNPKCPHCGNEEKTYKLGDGKTYKCGNKECYKKYTVTVGTIFENTNIPLSKWFMAIYICTAHKKGISSIQLAKDLGITQKSSWFMIHRIREMMRDKAPELLNNVVEADETYYGGKEANKHKSKRTPNSQGRNTETKAAIFGMLERQGEVRLQTISNVKRETLQPLIKENVARDATIVTDEWRSYNGIDKLFTQHLRVDHGKGNYVNGEAHTNSIEGFWSLLKRGLSGIQHQVSHRHLPRYCDEYAYRYNTRKQSDPERFTSILQRSEGRLTYPQLIQKEKPKTDGKEETQS